MNSRRRRLVLLLYLFTWIFAHAQISNSEPFSFVALGDMPYGHLKKTIPRYRALIKIINDEKPDFVAHVGDIKSGASSCTPEIYSQQLQLMNEFASPVLYTPGDNEWTDCQKEKAGSLDPSEGLAELRSLFFATSFSLGQRKIPLERQAAAMKDYFKFVENARMVHKKVMVATVHIVGSNNNYNPRKPDAVAEFARRNKANSAWIENTFSQAATQKVNAIVLVFHADVFKAKSLWNDFPARSGFTEFIAKTFLPLAQKWQKPILVVHGDSHKYTVDQPFKDEAGKTIFNITRLEVYGDKDMHAVKVTVDLKRPQSPFSFSTILNPMP